MNPLPLTGYIQREKTILDLCKGKRVLHLGCIGWTDLPVEMKMELANASFHATLSKVCDCTGIDIDAVGIRELHERSLFKNVEFGNAEHLEGEPVYDLIVAGDIIEHLSNPGLMLESAKKVLKPGGSFIISTPNLFALPAYLRMLTGRYHEGAQHTFMFNSILIQQLLERHGWHVAAAHACYQSRSESSPLFPLFSSVFRLFPKLAGTMLIVADRP